MGACITPRKALIVNDNNIRGALERNPDNPPLLGDRLLAAEPREFTEKLCADVRRGGTGRLLDTRVGKMTNYVLAHLEKRRWTDEDAKQFLVIILSSCCSTTIGGKNGGYLKLRNLMNIILAQIMGGIILTSC